MSPPITSLVSFNLSKILFSRFRPLNRHCVRGQNIAIWAPHQLRTTSLIPQLEKGLYKIKNRAYVRLISGKLEASVDQPLAFQIVVATEI